MFLGKHRCVIRENKRLTLPKMFLEMLSGGGFVTQGFDRNLWVLNKESFHTLCLQAGAMNMTDPAARLLRRMILGSAIELEVDRTGCIHIPSTLLDFAGIDAEAILIGQGDYFEVWSPSNWDKQEIRLQDAEMNAARFASLEITG